MYGKQSPAEERFLSSLPYLLPLVQALPLGFYLFQQFPFLAGINNLLSPLRPLSSNFILGFLVFFGFYLGVVRNRSFSKFVRFNTMQALLMVIGLSLLQLVAFQILSPILGIGAILIMSSGLFLLTYGLALYSFVYIWQGKYTDIPVLSEAANSQVIY